MRIKSGVEVMCVKVCVCAYANWIKGGVAIRGAYHKKRI